MFKVNLAIYSPRYKIIESRHERVIHVIDPSRNVFDDWSQEVYARSLAHAWNAYEFKFEEIYIPLDKVMSYLNNDDGSFMQLPKSIFKKDI